MKISALAVIALATLSCTASLPPGATASARGKVDAVELLVLSTTDVHGNIRGWDYFTNSVAPDRGLARAATIVDSIRTENSGRVLLVDAGDLLQGNAFAYVAMQNYADSANPIVAAMNTMRYDAAAIGNHEFNYGVPYLERAVAQARFPFLSANVQRLDGESAFRPWTIVDRKGVKVGIIGATTPGVMVWDAENVKGKLNVVDIIQAVEKAVQEVRAAGAHVVVVTIHSGLDGIATYDTLSTKLPSENVSGRLAREVPGIDLIVYGHSHREQKNLRIGSTLLIQPKNWATSVGVARLQIARAGAGWRVISSRGETIPVMNRAEAPAIVRVSAGPHAATVAYTNTVVGSTRVTWRGDSARLQDTPLIDFVLETMRKAAGADLASTAAFSLDASLDSGSITVAEMARLYPYDNTLRAIRITGTQLLQYLEFSARFYRGPGSGAGAAPITDPEIPGYNFDIVSGVNYTIDITRPIGSRVLDLSFRGRPVSPADSFTLAINNYRQGGGGGYAMLSGAPVVFDKQQEIRQLLIDEVKLRGEISPSNYYTRNWALRYPGAASALAPVATNERPLPAGTPRLRIIATNDFHGALEPRPDANGTMRGGAAYFAAAIKRARDECTPECETILLDGGDMFQGTLASNLAYGRPVVDLFNRMGYAAAALGNHEFDWGVDTLRARMRGARYAILGANVRFTDGRDVPWIRDDTLVTRGKLKIGVIGIASRLTPSTTRSANVANLKFLDPVPVIESRAKLLRERGADFIVVVAHDGAFCESDGATMCRGEIVEIANRIRTKVDAIVSGHTHSFIDATVNGIPIVQARSSGRAIAILDLPLASAGPLLTATAIVRDVTAAGPAATSEIDSLVRQATRRVSRLVNRRITSLAVPLSREGNQYALGNIIADAQRWGGKGDFAIMNNGGIRTGLRAGPVSYGDLYEVQPFGNTLYRLSMRGSKVRECLERIVSREQPRVHVSGITIGYNPAATQGARIVSLRLPDGRTLVDGATYSVIVNDFIATGGESLCSIKDAVRSTPLSVTDLEALTGYLATLKSPIVAPTDPRFLVRQ